MDTYTNPPHTLRPPKATAITERLPSLNLVPTDFVRSGGFIEHRLED